MGSTQGQHADYQRRMAAMQEARNRAQIPVGQPIRVASDTGHDYAAPPAPPARTVRATQTATRSTQPRTTARPTAKRARTAQPTARTARPQPRQTVRTARATQPKRVVLSQGSGSTVLSQGSGSTVLSQGSGSTILSQGSGALPGQPLGGQTFIDGGSPIVSGTQSAPIVGNQFGAPVVGAPVDGGVIVGETIVGESYVDSGAVGCGSCAGGCDSCGNSGGYFGDQCCGRGGCPS